MTQTRVELYHGDCLEVMPTLKAAGVAMVFADLPYATSRRKMTDCRWDLPFDLGAYWAANKLFCGSAVHVMTAVQPFASLLVCSNLKDFRYDVIWQRSRCTGYFNANRAPLRRHEHILIFSTKSAPYNPQMMHGHPYTRTGSRPVAAMFEKRQKTSLRLATQNGGVRYPTSIFTSTIQEKTKSHPTQKPLHLIEHLIKTYTNPGDTVLDPVMGSGTTGVACKRLGLHFIGIEKDKTYFDAAKARIQAEPWPTISNL